MAGPPLSFFGSDTYHMSSVIGAYDYVLYSGDTEFLARNWKGIKMAVQFVAAKIDNTGLLYVTGSNDWGRYAQGAYNTQANGLMYRTFIVGSILASWSNDGILARIWAAQAADLKHKINSQASNIWDPAKGCGFLLFSI